MVLGLKAFDEACASAAACGCAVAGVHISKLLKAVAGTPEALSVVRSAARRYDFVTEFNRSKVPSGVGGYRLLPPARTEEFVAYAFGILLYVDLGELDLPELLAVYFSDASEDVNAAYARFAAMIVERFRRAVLALAEAGNHVPAEQARGDVGDGESLSALRTLLSDCAARLATETLPDETKRDLTALCAALNRAALHGDLQFAAALNVGFRYAFGTLEGYESYVEGASRLLRRCGLIGERV